MNCQLVQDMGVAIPLNRCAVHDDFMCVTNRQYLIKKINYLICLDSARSLIKRLRKFVIDNEVKRLMKDRKGIKEELITEIKRMLGILKSEHETENTPPIPITEPPKRHATRNITKRQKNEVDKLLSEITMLKKFMECFKDNPEKVKKYLSEIRTHENKLKSYQSTIVRKT